jgi:hypothetical protein
MATSVWEEKVQKKSQEAKQTEILIELVCGSWIRFEWACIYRRFLDNWGTLPLSCWLIHKVQAFTNRDILAYCQQSKDPRAQCCKIAIS